MQTAPVTAMGLIRECLAQIVQNRRRLLPIMGLIWLLQLPSFFGDEEFIPLGAMQMMGLPAGAASIIPAIVVMLAVYPGAAWSAVGWHRLRLLGEEPARVLPRWHMRPVLAYLIVSIFLPLVTLGAPALLAVPVIVLLRALDTPEAPTIIVIMLAVVAAIWLSLRLSPMLVSRAVQNPVGLDEAMKRTAHMSRALWAVALLGCLSFAAIFGATELAAGLLIDPDGYYISDTALFLDGALFWVTYILFFLITISMFNTIYRRMSPMT